jgi:prepilin-type N-terminal cleavage/methylation domain-containing protein
MKVGLGGFTLLEIMIVVAIVGLLAGMAIPNFIRARADSQATCCINNLRQIDTAAQQVAIELNKHVGDTITYPNDITPYIKLNASKQLPPCPAGGNYIVNPVGSSPSVSCTLGTNVTPGHTF